MERKKKYRIVEKRREGKKRVIGKKWVLPGIEPMLGLKSTCKREGKKEEKEKKSGSYLKKPWREDWSSSGMHRPT